eukprot:6975372-Prymnesium_polylepis.1
MHEATPASVSCRASHVACSVSLRTARCESAEFRNRSAEFVSSPQNPLGGFPALGERQRTPYSTLNTTNGNWNSRRQPFLVSCFVEACSAGTACAPPVLRACSAVRPYAAARGVALAFPHGWSSSAPARAHTAR